jgi:GrpB-like predicted nucleotidyltransferase (UPF0157 family)
VTGRDEPVQVVPYDPGWPVRFEKERRRLATAIGDVVVGEIHHVGSTAVQGLDAKPVIDMLAGVRDLARSRACFGSLAALDYVYAPYRADEMHWFCKPDPAHRTHHLHLVPAASRRFHDELSFRDRLRADPALAADYAALKWQLAAEHKHDRDAYTAAKAEFIRAALRRPWLRDAPARVPPAGTKVDLTTICAANAALARAAAFRRARLQLTAGHRWGAERAAVAGRAHQQAKLAREAAGRGEEDRLGRGHPERGERGRDGSTGVGRGGIAHLTRAFAQVEQLDVLERDVGATTAGAALGCHEHVDARARLGAADGTAGAGNGYLHGAFAAP